MTGEKLIRQWVTRASDSLTEALRRYANERALEPAEVVRRAVAGLVLAPAAAEAPAPASAPKAPSVEVSNTEELGPDSLGAPNRSLAR